MTYEADTRELDGRRRSAGAAPNLLVVGTTSAPDDASARALVGHSIAIARSNPLIVGRGEEADIRIEDASVSRRHARLTVGDRVEVEDLGSTNGTRVRDRALSEGERVTLAPGDLVEFGGVLCLMRGPSRDAPRAVEAPASTPSELVVEDPAMRQLHALTARVARAAVPVLLLGETGVGKEVFAERLHALAPRASGPYVKVNCGNLTESTFESELFGYEKGAFTGANAARAGLIESAAGGTLFLDEVGELPPAMQTRLLRVLEDREVRRIGASKGRAVDVRFVAATNRELEAEVAAGRFRADLFYRLNGFVLTIPPLRERVAEVVPLALRFARKARAQLGLSGDATLKTSATAWLEAYPWPGNIRELRNAMERAVLLAEDEPISLEHLTAQRSKPAPPVAAAKPSAGPDDERARIVAALEQCVGNQTRAAKLLGISRRTLVSKLGLYDVPRPRKAP